MVPRKFKGLSNLGNTCFMNSILQCLSSTPGLAEYFLSRKYEEDVPKVSRLVDSFAEVIDELWTRAIGGAVVPLSLKTEIGRRAPQFVGYSQQDSQEFLRFLVDGLHEDTNMAKLRPSQVPRIPDGLAGEEVARMAQENYRQYAVSYMSDLFSGHTRSTLTCLECGFESVTVEPMWDLSVPVVDSRDTYGRDITCSLVECLQSFVTAETLDGNEMPTCERCRQRRRSTKALRVERLPQILVLHLKRFSYTIRSRAKISTEVRFPLQSLDMAPYTTQHQRHQPALYDLFAVSNHSGGLGGGHYTAYCCYPGGSWHHFNDSSVSECDASSVRGPQAYVLFYRRKLPASSL